ncbi:MAG: transporter substrate-binding domain-containing protein, partial [Oscillospiraceae bacterium]
MKQAVLYASPKNENLFYEEFDALNGKKIGLLQDSLNNGFFDEYAKHNNFEYVRVEYSNETEMTEALKNGEVTAIATESMAYHDDLKLIGKYGAEPYFLISYKGNDIMGGINHAMSEIFTSNISFAADLYKKHYGESTSEKDISFTRSEFEYVQSLPTLKISVSSTLKPL